jgi:hypothetical protein
MTGSLKADKKAASLVPQIVKVHEQLVEIESEGFTAALNKVIELGVLLNLAQEAVYSGHFWTWFKEQRFAFSDRSARRWMRLAKNREALEEALADWPRVAKMAGEGLLSVRAAEALLAPESASSSESESSESSESEASESESSSSSDSGGGGGNNVEKLRDLIRKMLLNEIVTAVVEAIGPSAKQIADGITQRLEKAEAA